MSAPTTAEVREALVQAELAETAFVNTQPAAMAFFAVRAVLETTALPLAEERDAERARADAAEAESKRRGELLAAERERYVALQRTLDNERHAAMDKSASLMAADAEVARLRADIDMFQRMLGALDRPTLRHLIAAADALESLALAAGLPATATPAEVVARVGEMREAAVAVVRCVGYDLTTARAIDRLRAALASEAGR